MGAEALTIPVKEEWQITGALRHDHPVYRFFPHKTKGEGFFLAALRKAPGETEEIRPRNKSKKERGKAAPVLPSVVNDWIEEAGKFRFELINDTIQAIPSAHQETWQLIAGQCRIVTAGIRVGEIKGKDILPAHSLAMSTSLNREAFTTVEINWEDAVKYLKKEVLLLPEETKKGYVLVCYNGFPLGFVKHLGNRANNLYPQEWRIRSGYLPDKVVLYPES